MGLSVRTTRSLRAANRRHLLQTIRSETRISAARLAERCGLRPSTVSSILRDLRAEGCVEVCGHGASTQQGGKRPTLIALRGAHGAVVGVSLEGGDIRLAVRDFALESLVRRRLPLEGDPVPALISAVAASVGPMGPGPARILRGAVARPAGASPRERRLCEAIAKALAKWSGATVDVVAGGHLAACGEWVFVRDREPSDLVFIRLGSPDARTADIGMILDGMVQPDRGATSGGARVVSAMIERGGVAEVIDLVTGLLDPDEIVVGGDGIDERDIVAALPRRSDLPPIRLATYGPNAAAEGGAAFAYERALDAIANRSEGGAADVGEIG